MNDWMKRYYRNLWDREGELWGIHTCPDGYEMPAPLCILHRTRYWKDEDARWRTIARRWWTTLRPDRCMMPPRRLTSHSRCCETEAEEIEPKMVLATDLNESADRWLWGLPDLPYSSRPAFERALEQNRQAEKHSEQNPRMDM